jgi:curved DNA-binding protein CbpA
MSKRFVGGSTSAAKDLYELLQVKHGSTLSEIKVAYKKLALVLHPDRNRGDPHLTQQFKDVTEAYSILSNDASRRQYDLNHGLRYNANRRTPPPKNYRKVYTPVRPPKSAIFDHDRHYDMHYGRGMMDEAVQSASSSRQQQPNGSSRKTNTTKINGYQSPLGNGFTFGGGGINETINPYANSSKKRASTQQQTVWQYEEGTMFDGTTAKGNVHRREEIVQDLTGKRYVRKQKEAAQQQRDEAANSSAFASQQDACIIQ